VIEEGFPLAQAADAHERLQYGRARGKIVLTFEQRDRACGSTPGQAVRHHRSPPSPRCGE
jgi:Zinc-binding dehydrogenase